MIKKTIILIALILFPVTAYAGNIWIKFKLIDRPYYDQAGNLIPDIRNMKNRKNIDAFSGGGNVYPVLPNKAVEAYQFKNEYLVYVDIGKDPTDWIKRNDKLDFQASPKKTQYYNFGDFGATILDDDQAKKLKIEWGIMPETESGTTTIKVK